MFLFWQKCSYSDYDEARNNNNNNSNCNQREPSLGRTCNDDDLRKLKDDIIKTIQ
jgi:hypothetical protein